MVSEGGLFIARHVLGYSSRDIDAALGITLILAHGSDTRGDKAKRSLAGTGNEQRATDSVPIFWLTYVQTLLESVLGPFDISQIFILF